jgi:hypothetical protein
MGEKCMEAAITGKGSHITPQKSAELISIAAEA